jgi:hypothetical protein
MVNASHNSRGDVSILALLLVAMSGTVPITAGQEYWWLAPVISGVALAAVVWFQWGQHKVRTIRARRGFSATMVVAPEAGKIEACEVRVPPNSQISLQLRMRPRLHYRQMEIIFGFRGDALQRPVPLHVLNSYIKHGKRRIQSPDTNPDHYIDHEEFYHIKETSERTYPNVYTLGFLVQTRNPGRYPVLLEAMTDCGEAKAKEELVLIVDAELPAYVHSATQ